MADSIAGYVYPDDWVEFDGHRYIFYPDTTITALESRTACLEHGALLASINSAEEQEFISTSVFSKRTLAAFISAEQMRSKVNRTGAKYLVTTLK